MNHYIISYFQGEIKFIDEEGKTKARCIYCSKEYMADRKFMGHLI